jgi:hypothetical protein
LFFAQLAGFFQNALVLKLPQVLQVRPLRLKSHAVAVVCIFRGGRFMSVEFAGKFSEKLNSFINEPHGLCRLLENRFQVEACFPYETARQKYIVAKSGKVQLSFSLYEKLIGSR